MDRGDMGRWREKVTLGERVNDVFHADPATTLYVGTEALGLQMTLLFFTANEIMKEENHDIP